MEAPKNLSAAKLISRIRYSFIVVGKRVYAPRLSERRQSLLRTLQFKIFDAFFRYFQGLNRLREAVEIPDRVISEPFCMLC